MLTRSLCLSVSRSGLLCARYLGLISLLFWLLEANADISEIVVVSSRDVFGHLSVIKPVDAIEIETGSSGIRTADFLSRLPGVDLNGQGGSLQTYTIRGFSRARVQTIVAGIPLYTERRAGNSATFIDPFLIQQIAVIKGPASTLYGSGAIGGVVSLKPKTFNSPELSGSFYSQGEQKMIGAGWGNQQLSVGIAYRKHERSEDVENNQLNDGMERFSSSLGWTRDFTGFSVNSQVVVAHGKDIGKSSSDFPDKRITQYPVEDHFMASVQLENDDWLFDLYAHEQALDTVVSRSGRSPAGTYSESTDFGGSAIRGWYDSQSSFRVGLDLDVRRNVRVVETTMTEMGERTFLPLSGDQIEGAVFADGRWQNSAVTINAGIRYARIEQDSQGVSQVDGVSRLNDVSQTDDAWTGTVAIRSSFSKYWEGFAQIGTGYRFPELTEKFFNGTTGRGIIIGSPDLDAERSVSSEIGIIGEFSHLSIHSSIYYTEVKDYIERIEIADRLFTFQNLLDGTVRGAEVTVELELNSNWRIETTGHWMEGVNDKDQYLADMSPSRINIMLVSQRPWGEIMLDYRHRFESSRVHVDELPVDQYDRILFRITIPVGDSSVLSFWADNVLDDDFRTTTDSLSPQSTRSGVGVAFTWIN